SCEASPSAGSAEPASGIASAGTGRSEFAAALVRSRHRYLVGILNVAACRHAGGNSSDTYGEFAQSPCQPACCSFPFKGRACRHNYLIDLTALGPQYKRVTAQLV